MPDPRYTVARDRCVRCVSCGLPQPVHRALCLECSLLAARSSAPGEYANRPHRSLRAGLVAEYRERAERGEGLFHGEGDHG